METQILATASSSLTSPQAPCAVRSAPSSHQVNAGGLFRGLLLSQLAPMQRGHLVMQMPEGTCVTFGKEPESGARLLPLGLARSARILVKDETFFRRCVLAGDIGFAEAYIAGEWESPDLAAVVAWALLNVESAPALSGSARKGIFSGLGFNLLRLVNRIGHLMRPNSRRIARRNIGEHYDLSNGFFQLMLDPTMMYSAALWSDPDQTLEEAQNAKNENLCRLLRLRPSDRVLEIGCGWGGWAVHAARHYGCCVTALTISEQQFTFAWDRVQAAGVSDRVKVELCDFRDVRGRFDKIVSIEMMEALGHRYQPVFCEAVARALEPQGLLALQFITCPDNRYEQMRKGVDFIQKHIFPGSLLLSLNRINGLLAASGGFILNQITDMGHDYARTLRRWRENLVGREPQIESMGFDARFLRKWDYYLQYCEAAFAMRNISVVQTLHSRPNNLLL